MNISVIKVFKLNGNNVHFVTGQQEDIATKVRSLETNVEGVKGRLA